VVLTENDSEIVMPEEFKKEEIVLFSSELRDEAKKQHV